MLPGAVEPGWPRRKMACIRAADRLPAHPEPNGPERCGRAGAGRGSWVRLPQRGKLSRPPGDAPGSSPPPGRLAQTPPGQARPPAGSRPARRQCAARSGGLPHRPSRSGRCRRLSKNRPALPRRRRSCARRLADSSRDQPIEETSARTPDTARSGRRERTPPPRASPARPACCRARTHAASQPRDGTMNDETVPSRSPGSSLP